MSASARTLELLSLLQGRRHWSGDDLAVRLEVSPRTLRRDVARLQELGYPVETSRGTGGGYRLSPGASLPPLVLTEDEAAAATLGLSEIAARPALAESAVSALAKIVQVMPTRIRRRVDALRAITASRQATAADALDLMNLTTLSMACRDGEVVTFAYRSREGDETERAVEPHQLAVVDQRFYLVAFDRTRADWRTFRVDRITSTSGAGSHFAPRQLPYDDVVVYLQRQFKEIRRQYIVRARVEASAEAVSETVGEYARATPVGSEACEVEVPTDDLEWAVFALGGLGIPFRVEGPPAAVDHFREWAERLAKAVTASSGSTS